MIEKPTLKIFSIKTFDAESCIRHWSFKEKKQNLKNDFHLRDLMSFSHVCQVAGFGTLSPLLVHKEKEGEKH